MLDRALAEEMTGHLVRTSTTYGRPAGGGRGGYVPDDPALGALIEDAATRAWAAGASRRGSGVLGLLFLRQRGRGW